MDEFTQHAIAAIQAVPAGKVSTYGEIAKQAGNNKGAQRVAEILHLLSQKHELPWQRIINAQGEVAINDPQLAKLQRALLEQEGIVFKDDRVNMEKYLFRPNQADLGGFF